jgi:hypothetical protein
VRLAQCGFAEEGGCLRRVGGYEDHLREGYREGYHEDRRVEDRLQRSDLSGLLV